MTVAMYLHVRRVLGMFTIVGVGGDGSRECPEPGNRRG